MCTHRCRLSFEKEKTLYTQTHMAQPFANNISQKHIFHLESIQSVVVRLNQVSHGSRDFFHISYSQNPSSHSQHFGLSIPLSVSVSVSMSSWSTLVFTHFCLECHLWMRMRHKWMRTVFAVAARIKDNQIVWVEWKFGTLYTNGWRCCCCWWCCYCASFLFFFSFVHRIH